MASKQWLIRQYNRGELSEEQAEAFEIQMINDPVLAQDVELDDLLARGAASARFPAPVPRPRWPLAAGLGLVAAAVALVMMRGTPSPRAWGQVAFVELGELRGAGSRTSIVTLSENHVAIVEVPALAEADLQDVVLMLDDRVALRVPTRPRAGVLTIALAPGSVPTGDYVVSARSNDRQGPNYVLQVR